MEEVDNVALYNLHAEEVGVKIAAVYAAVYDNLKERLAKANQIELEKLDKLLDQIAALIPPR